MPEHLPLNMHYLFPFRNIYNTFIYYTLLNIFTYVPAD